MMWNELCEEKKNSSRGSEGAVEAKGLTIFIGLWLFETAT